MKAGFIAGFWLGGPNKLATECIKVVAFKKDYSLVIAHY